MCLTFRLETLQFAFTNQSEFIVPARCAEGCRRCSTVNPEYCYDCLGGFALTDGICVHCENDCASCTPTDRKTCLSCFENAYLLNGVCNQCNASSNCLTCDRTNTSKCESCPYGLKRVNGVCEDSCGNNCLLCNQTADSVVCTYCRPGCRSRMAHHTPRYTTMMSSRNILVHRLCIPNHYMSDSC